MNTQLQNSKTKESLMRSFAGECQARTRYDNAAQQLSQKLYVVSALFKFTANQEREHAEVFYKHMQPLAGGTVDISGGYPVDISNDAAELLEAAAHNEHEEHDVVYASFGKIAREEGFSRIAQDFENIAKIEAEHAKRFEYFAKLLREGKLFVSDVSTKWMCLNCGFILEGTQAPQSCPVCSHDQGYFIRFELSPWCEKQC